MSTNGLKRSCISVILLITICFLLILTSCETEKNGDEYVSAELYGPTEISVGEFNISDYKLILHTAEGETKEVTVTEDILTIDNVSQFDKAGKYALSVEYLGISLTLQITVKRDVYDISGIVFEDETVVYDGKEHNLEIKGELPAGVTVTYEGNGQIDAGVYTVTAKFSGDNEKFEAIEDMTATLTIEKRELELAVTGETALVFNDKEQKTINVVATNVLEGDEVALSVVYSGNMTDVGKYTATIVLEENKNYKLPEEGTVINITISKRMFRVFFKQEGQPDIVCEVPEGTALDINSVREPVQIPGYDVEWEETDLSCVTEDIEVGTVKTPLLFEITYVLNGGENNVENPATYTIESDTINLHVPKKSLSTFEGWYTTEGFSAGTKIAAIESGSIGNITLYAKWIDYRIETAYGFDIDYSGEIPTVKKVVSNSIVNVDLNASFTVSEGCTWKLYADFIGNEEYKLKAMTLGVGENIAYIIVYHPDGEHFTRYALNIYRLDIKEYTFMDGLNQWYSGSVEETGTIYAPGSNPSKTGYTFAGWSVNGFVVRFPYQINESTVFQATYTPIQYKITYNLNGGRIYGEDTDYTIEEDVIFVTPKREHYVFEGWYYTRDFSSEKVGSTGVGSYGDIKIYAKWTPVEYSIEYVLNGDSVENANRTSYNIETPTFSLIAPARAGYTFCGWYKDESLSESCNTIEKGTTGKITLYAKWTANENTIHFDGNGATAGSMSDIKMFTDETATLPLNAFVKAGYSFAGWTDEAQEKEIEDGGSYTMGTKSYNVLYAVWEPNLNTLRFDGNGATSGQMSDKKIHTDESVKLTSNAYSREHYIFEGWSSTPGGEVEWANGATYIMGTEQINVVYAVWSPVDYSIVYNLNGGVNDPSNPSVYNVESGEIVLNAPTKDYYDFVEWKINGQSGDRIPAGYNGNIVTCVAVWEPVVYNINYELGGGTNSLENPDTYTVESDFVLMQPQKEFYHFVEWQVDGEICDHVSAGSHGDITFTAVWEAIDYSIIYYLDGGQNSDLNPDTYTVEDLPLKLSDATKEDCKFVGWYTSSDYTTSIQEITSCMYSIRLYAKFFQYTEGLQFSLSEDGTYYKVSGYEGDSEEVIISNTYNGKPVKEIASSAFQDNTSITKVLIPENISILGTSAFANCTSLSEINYNAEQVKNLDLLNCNVFSNAGTDTDGISVIFGDSVRYIPSFLFFNLSGGLTLKSVKMSSSIEAIGEDAFGCNVQNIYIDDLIAWCGINHADSGLFNGADAKLYLNGELVTDLVIPDNVTHIGNYAFTGYTLLKSVTMSESIVSVGTNTFEGCSALKSVNVPDIDFWCGLNFYGENGNPLKNGADLYVDGVVQTDIIVSEDVGDYAFIGYKPLKSVMFENGVTSIGTRAFYECTSLVDATMSESITNINVEAFAYCSSLDRIIIHDTLKTMGSSAFSGCGSIVIYCEHASRPTSIQWQMGWEGEGTAVWGYEYVYYEGVMYGIKDSDVFVVRQHQSLSDDIEIAANISINGNVCSVTGVGDGAFANCNSLVSVTIPEGITSVGSSAFGGCSSLLTVTIPSSVTSIGESAFESCVSLSEVYYNAVNVSDLTMFKSDVFCNAGTSGEGVNIIFGDSVERIPANLVRVMLGAVKPKIRSVTMGKNINSIGDNAFYDCKDLKAVYITDIEAWCNMSFDKASLNPLYYSGKLYLNGELLTQLVIPDGVTEIGSYVFYNCVSITNLIIPDSVRSIGASAFSGCVSLTSITIPDGITSIGENAFYNCRSCTVVNISGSVTDIGSGAFGYCASLKEINVAENNAVYKSNDGNLYNKAMTELIQYAVGKPDISWVIPEGVTSIGSYAFSGCSSLTSITIPAGVTSIGSYAFRGCSSLESITFTNTQGWWYSSSETDTSGTEISGLEDPLQAATYLKSDYSSYYWKRGNSVEE